MHYRIAPNVLNPNGYYLLKYLQDTDIRFIILFGGSSSGKSYSVAQSVLIMTLIDGANTLVMRKVGASILRTIYEDYKVAARGLGIYHMFKFQINCIRCANGAKIDFGGLDDPEKIKGISNYKRVQLEELSEFSHADLKQIRKRLRGMLGQQIICTFNPISEKHWIKVELLDKEEWHDVPMQLEIGGAKVPEELCKVKSLKMNAEKPMLNPRTKEIETRPPNMVLIQSTYLNNFWVVGSPDGTFGFYDEQCLADFENDRINDPDYYNVYALGEWGILRTGGEFLGSFNLSKCSQQEGVRTEIPIHISVDNNVLPYISISFWQIDCKEGKKIRQFHEICAAPPYNTVRKAATLAANYIHECGKDEVFLHGDASTRAASTFDEEKRSWMDLFIETLSQNGLEVIDKVGNKNPPVAMTGEFINAVFDGQVDGVDITIGENCKNSIDDYLSVQKDENGAIAKRRIKDPVTKNAYEEHGHLTDTFRYLVYDVCRDEYTTFTNRRKRNLFANNGLNFYNSDTEYVSTDKVVYMMPNVNGKFVLIKGEHVGESWYVTEICFRTIDSTQEMKKCIEMLEFDVCFVECSDAYFSLVREMRAEMNRDFRVLKASTEPEKRIAAMSDFVRNKVLFSTAKVEEELEYGSFYTNLLEYNANSEFKEASTAISGFAQFVAKYFSN